MVVSRNARNVASEATPKTRHAWGEGEEGTRNDPWGRKKIERSVGLLQKTDRSCYYFL
jgi:hypothetical protein